MNTKALQETTKKWKELGRKTEEQRKKAEDFYEKNLMKLIEEAFITNNQSKITEHVEYLIMSVGTSYEPLVLSIQLLKPKKILFLYTQKTKKILSKIIDYCGLNISNIDMKKVNETDPTDIYREIKHVYLEWKKPEKIYIDFTGGTKAMSTAAAMAGNMIRVQLIYVGTDDYLTDFRKPEPGSERLYFISNPLKIFGDLEIEKAIVLFSQYNYSGAAEKLEILKEQIPDPSLRQQLNFVYLLARGYEAWDALEFHKAYDYLSMLTAELERDRILHSSFLLMDFTDEIRNQKEILGNLLLIEELPKNKAQMEMFTRSECMISLMFTIYQNAYVRARQEKYDMATLLMYRLLEMIEQKRLANYGLNVSHMDYTKIPCEKCGLNLPTANREQMKVEWLEKEVRILKSRLFRIPGKGSLPDQVSLLEGFLLLQVLRDPICVSGKVSGINKLKQIRSMVFLRNNSIFAHGLGPISGGEYMRFQEFVVQIFREFCTLEKIDFEKIKEQITWKNPVDSRNYSGMEGV